MLLSKHRSIACPLPLALASDLPCGVCSCKWDLQLLSTGWLWTDFPRPRGWRVTTALGNPFPCGTALGNPFPCRKVCFAQKAPLDQPLYGSLNKYLGSQDFGPHMLFVLKLSRAPLGYPRKFRDVPPKTLISLGFKGHTELVGPHTFTWKTTTPPEDIKIKKYVFVLVHRWSSTGVKKASPSKTPKKI